MACRADGASPDLLMVSNVQFSEGSLVTLVRVNIHEGHESMR